MCSEPDAKPIACAQCLRVDHFTLFDRVTGLEVERDNYKEQLQQLQEQNRQLAVRLAEAEAFKQEVCVSSDSHSVEQG